MKLSRREFLKMAGLGAGVIGLYPYQQQVPHVEFPAYNRLGRICVGRVDLKARPDQDSETLGLLYEDKIVPWLREVVGKKPYYFNQRWLETPDGFIYAPYVQPVQNLPNTPVNNLSDTVLGLGMWVEVTVPYVDVILENTPSSNSWVKSRIDEALPVRLYYSQVFWVDQIKQSEQGQILYRVNPNYYGGVDMLWAAAEAFRPITHEELSPINPEIEEKRIVVDVTHQTLSCFEENTEVYFSRVSTGAKFDVFGNAVDKWATPVGKHRISRKFISLQMSGGTTGAGYDLPGIGWTSIFVTGGVAIHSTFWHNDYGVPRSHGCVNVRPEDAKWIFRWSAPAVPYGTGMIDVSLTGDPSTRIDVIEG